MWYFPQWYCKEWNHITVALSQLKTSIYYLTDNTIQLNKNTCNIICKYYKYLHNSDIFYGIILSQKTIQLNEDTYNGLGYFRLKHFRLKHFRLRNIILMEHSSNKTFVWRNIRLTTAYIYLDGCWPWSNGTFV